MITWLNKQLNDKAGVPSHLTGAAAAGSTSYSANKYSNLPKPPTS